MKLGLFFTAGVSLKKWQEVGILDREIKPYKYLLSHFDEIIFLTYGAEDDLGFDSIVCDKIKVLPKRQKIPSLLYSLLMPFLYYKELKGIDVFKTNQMIGSWTAVIAKIFFKKKLVVRQGYQLAIFAERAGYNFFKMLIVRFLEKLVYKNADKIIVSSRGDKKYIEERYHILSEKIKYIPNYIDTELFKPLNISKENRVCFIGRLVKKKNIFNLIRAISGLDIKLVIFGSGPLKKDLEDFSRRLNVNTEFKGNIPNRDLARELNKSKLFVLPSLFEGCPKVLLEAMACGLPVIGTNVYGTAEIIKHKENGYLCETNSASIRKAIIEVLNDKELQERIKINARATILKKFSLEKIIRKEIDIYKNI